MHIASEKTQNEKKIIDILDDINKSVQHLILNDKSLMEANNEGMEKDQPSTNN